MQSQKVKTLTGVVVSSSGNKSVRIVVDYKVRHPKYGKYIKRSTKLHAHDAENSCHEGDLVEISQCRPLSKTKSWRLHKIVTKGAA